jgi:hypothetical protein
MAMSDRRLRGLFIGWNLQKKALPTPATAALVSYPEGSRPLVRRAILNPGSE